MDPFCWHQASDLPLISPVVRRCGPFRYTSDSHKADFGWFGFILGWPEMCAAAAEKAKCKMNPNSGTFRVVRNNARERLTCWSISQLCLACLFSALSRIWVRKLLLTVQEPNQKHKVTWPDLLALRVFDDYRQHLDFFQIAREARSQLLLVITMLWAILRVGCCDYEPSELRPSPSSCQPWADRRPWTLCTNPKARPFFARPVDSRGSCPTCVPISDSLLTSPDSHQGCCHLNRENQGTCREKGFRYNNLEPRGNFKGSAGGSHIWGGAEATTGYLSRCLLYCKAHSSRATLFSPYVMGHFGLPFLLLRDIYL